MWLRNLIWFSTLSSFLFFKFFFSYCTHSSSSTYFILLRHPNFEHSSPLYIYCIYFYLFIIIIILGNIFWRLMTSYKLRAQDKQQDHHLKSKYLTTDHPLHSLRPSWLSVKRTHFTIYLVWRSRVSCVVIALWVALITFLYVFYLLLFIYYFFRERVWKRVWLSLDTQVKYLNLIQIH